MSISTSKRDTNPSNSHDEQDERPESKRVKLGEQDSGTAILTSDFIEPSSPTASTSQRGERSGGGRGQQGRRERGQRIGGRGRQGQERGQRGRERDFKGKNKETQSDGPDRSKEGRSNGIRVKSNPQKMDDDVVVERDVDVQRKMPKKKVALLIGYLGLDYSGSQMFAPAFLVLRVKADRGLCSIYRNPGVKTIESEVFDACVKAGCISADNSDNPTKVLRYS